MTTIRRLPRPARVAVSAVVMGAMAFGAVGLTACSASDAAAASDLGSKENPVELGTVGASDPYWQTFVKEAEAEGIYINLVDFTEYTQPNPALSEGELDINSFQHIQYLGTYNATSGDDLQPIASNIIVPLGLYSTKHDSVEDIPDGGTVVVPDDTVNQARGLLVLQAAGLVELEDGGSSFSTLNDVLPESRVEVKALAADVTVTSLVDVDAAIVNNSFIHNAGLDPDDAIAKDDPSDPKAAPYVNVFAVKKADVDNPVLNELVKLFQDSEAVKEGIQEKNAGTAVFVRKSAQELQDALAIVEKSVKEK